MKISNKKTIKKALFSRLKKIHLLFNCQRPELLDLSKIANILGYTNDLNILEIAVLPKGYRILSKMPRLPGSVIKNIVDHFENFPKIIKASIEELYAVEGIGEIRARNIKDGLRRLRDQVLLDRHLLKK